MEVKRTLHIGLQEISLVRLVCKCSTAVEAPLGELYKFDSKDCPKCGEPFSPGTDHHLAELQHAIEYFRRADGHLKIEFPLPFDEP